MNLVMAVLAVVGGYVVGSMSLARLVVTQFAPRQDISRNVPAGDALF